MYAQNFDPWKNINEFDPAQFADKSSELRQWPIKLWKAPVVSPYYHSAHLLIAADCSAFACPTFHDRYARGKVALICCMDTDFDVMTKLCKILEHNSVKSITVVKTDKPAAMISLPQFCRLRHPATCRFLSRPPQFSSKPRMSVRKLSKKYPPGELVWSN